MLSKNIQIIKRLNIIACSNKCKCMDQINIINNKPIRNKLEEAFYSFQLKEQFDKYSNCLNSKKVKY